MPAHRWFNWFRLLKSSRQLAEPVTQKLSSTALPRSAPSVRTSPVKSEREKSGEDTGASNQVSTIVGSDSMSFWPLFASTTFGEGTASVPTALTNASALYDSFPSS